MCNVCNSGAFGRGSCGYAFNSLNSFHSTGSGNGYGCSRGCSCGCWNGAWQRVCRDACGNILVRNRSNSACCQNRCYPCGCGCHCNGGCGGCNGSGDNSNTQNGNTNGNGSFRCITFCGNATAQTANNTSSYYARQYGLTGGYNVDRVYND